MVYYQVCSRIVRVDNCKSCLFIIFLGWYWNLHFTSHCDTNREQDVENNGWSRCMELVRTRSWYAYISNLRIPFPHRLSLIIRSRLRILDAEL